MAIAFYLTEMNKEILQTMKILSIDKICPFEWNLYQNQSLEIEDIHHIRHPFLVTPLENGTYLLLEESAEYYALLQAGITQLPVQVIQPEQIIIKQETIGICSFNENDLGDILTEDSGSISCRNAQDETSSNDVVQLYLGEKKYHLDSIDSDNSGCPIVVTKLFEFFEKNGGYRMLAKQGALSDSLMKIHQFSASLELPKFRYEHIIKAIETNLLFPPSVLYLSAGLRILFIDFPLSTLVSDNSIIEKEIFLKELILLREQAAKTSIYEGRVYLLNR